MRYNKAMRKYNNEKSVGQEITEHCPVLYRMRHRPMTETCMCWGFECGDGWLENIRDLSYELETLNSEFYAKYRTRIQADQVKEKFGMLHFYHSVVVDHGKFLTYVLGMMQQFSDFCLDREFGCRYVVDVEPYEYDDVIELTKEEYDSAISEKYRCTNVKYRKNGDKYEKVTRLKNYGKRHAVPTKNRLWWYVGHAVEKIMWKIDFMFEKRDDIETRRVVRHMDIAAEELIRKYEQKCYDTCEVCGAQIGTEWSPRCETNGWVTYICDRCAEKHSGTYRKNGKVYYGTQVVEDCKNNGRGDSREGK